MMTTDIQAVPDRLRLLAEELRTFEHPRPYSILSSYCQRQVFGVGSVEFSFSQHIENERARLSRFIDRQLCQAGLLLTDAIGAGLLGDDIQLLPIIDACRWAQRRREETAQVAWLGRFARWALIQFYDLQQAHIIVGTFPRPPIRSSVPIPATDRLVAYRRWVADGIAALASFIDSRIRTDSQLQNEELSSCT